MLALQSVLHLHAERLDTSTQQIDIVVALFEEMVGVFDSFLLVKVVQHDDLILLVLVLEQLGDRLVLFDAWAWEA